MSPPPRRLSFAVGTSLLGASLSLGTVGCTDKDLESDDRRVTNPRIRDEVEDHVNVRAPDPEPTPEPTPEPEQPTVNVRAPDPEPTPEPEPTQENVPKPEPEPKRVNVRPR